MRKRSTELGELERRIRAARLALNYSQEDLARESLGDFDFYSELGNGMRCVIEWETGNISSSHRTMNKLCLVMLAGLIDIGVVILPSRQLYSHLIDRIGSWEKHFSIYAEATAGACVGWQIR